MDQRVNIVMHSDFIIFSFYYYISLRMPIYIPHPYIYIRSDNLHLNIMKTQALHIVPLHYVSIGKKQIRILWLSNYEQNRMSEQKCKMHMIADALIQN